MVQLDLVGVVTVTTTQLFSVPVQVVVQHAHVQAAKVSGLFQHLLRDDGADLVELEVTLFRLLYRLVFVGLELFEIVNRVLDVLLAVTASHLRDEVVEVLVVSGRGASCAAVDGADCLLQHRCPWYCGFGHS